MRVRWTVRPNLLGWLEPGIFLAAVAHGTDRASHHTFLLSYPCSSPAVGNWIQPTPVPRSVSPLPHSAPSRTLVRPIAPFLSPFARIRTRDPSITGSSRAQGRPVASSLVKVLSSAVINLVDGGLTTAQSARAASFSTRSPQPPLSSARIRLPFRNQSY